MLSNLLLLLLLLLGLYSPKPQEPSQDVALAPSQKIEVPSQPVQVTPITPTTPVVEPPPEPVVEAPVVSTIKLTIVGDCLITSDKGITTPGSFLAKCKEGDWEWFLGGVRDWFEDDDFTIVNLENVITDNPLTEKPKDHSPAYWYRGPTENMQILTSSSVEVCNLSNNHTGDYDTQGAQDTIQACKDYGLEYGTNERTVYLEKDGYRIALICNGLWYEGQEQTIIKRLKVAEENSDFQIVYYHGGTERVHVVEDWRVRSSRRLVDAGADLVIGNHPHVLQPMEEYNGVTIIYSMGNFCWGASKHPENRTGMYRFELTITDGELTAAEGNFIPCYVYTGDSNNWRPEVITDETDKQAVLDYMHGLRSSPI